MGSRTTVEDTFTRLVELANSLDVEQRRAVAEGLTEDELALFDLLDQDGIAKSERERLKQASRDLLSKLQGLLATMEQWTRNAQTQAEVEAFILDHLCVTLPRPPFTEEETQKVAARVYEYVWQRSSGGGGLRPGRIGAVAGRSASSARRPWLCCQVVCG